MKHPISKIKSYRNQTGDRYKKEIQMSKQTKP